VSPTGSRELRSLVPFEVLAVLVIAATPFPDVLPIALPLVIAGSISRWLRGRSWAEVTARGGEIGRGTRIGVGLAVGAVALALAVIVGTNGVAALSQRSVEWSEHAVVRGNAKLVAIVMLHVGVTAIAAELALRGWVVERVLELSPGSPVLPVMVGGIAEAMVTSGDAGARLGAAVFGIGLGWIYVAGGRNAIAPISARVMFQCGAVAIEAFRLV